MRRVCKEMKYGLKTVAFPWATIVYGGMIPLLIIESK